MNVVTAAIRKTLICGFVLTLSGTAGSAQVGPAQALLQIDGTLQKILGLLEAQVSLEANREDARLLMQRLRLQADRLQPLENELKELRLRRSTLEQELAAGNEQIRQAEDRLGTSEFERLLQNQIDAQADELRTLEASLQSLATRIRTRESELLTERAIYDDLAEAIDERLGLR